MGEERKITPSRIGRAVRFLLRFLRRVLTGVVLTLVAIWILLQIPFVSTFAARTALSLANPWPRTNITIGSAGGSWLSSLSLTNVRIANASDSLLISIDTLRVSYDLPALFGNLLHFREVSLTRPLVRTRFLADGTPLFLEPFAPDTTDRDTSAGLMVRGDHLQVTDGQLVLMSRPDTTLHDIDVHEIHLQADSILIAGGIQARIDTLCSGVTPNLICEKEIRLAVAGALTKDLILVHSLHFASSESRIEAEGQVPLPLTLRHLLSNADLRLSASPIAYGDIHFLLPEFGPKGEARLEVELARRGDSSSCNLTLEIPGGGRVSVQGKTYNKDGDTVALDFTGTTREFSPAGLTGMADESESLTTTFRVTGSGTTLADFSGGASLDISKSYFGGMRPLAGIVRARMLEGEIHSVIQAGMRPVLVKAETDLRPFDPTISYRAAGSISISHSDSPDSLWQRLEGLVASFSVNGRGTSIHDLQANATLNGEWRGNPGLKKLRVEGTANHDTLSAKGELFTASGSLRTAAEAILSDVPEFRIHSTIFHGLSLASFGNHLPSSSLTGSLRAALRGRSLSGLTGSLSLDLDSSTVTDFTVNQLSTEVAADQGQFRFRSYGESSAGSFTLGGVVAPSARSPRLTLESASFRGLDLGKILGREGISSNLNGGIQFKAMARSINDISRLLKDSLKNGERAVLAHATLRLVDSRLNNDTIRAGTVELELLDGNLRTTLDIQTSKGGLHGSAEGHPFGRAPTVSVPTLRMDHLDIGALAGKNNLQTDLTGEIKGKWHGNSVENATGELTVDLLNSSSGGSLPAGETLRANIKGGQFTLHSRTEFNDGGATLDATGRLLAGSVAGKIAFVAGIRDSASQAALASMGPTGLMISGSVEGTWGLPAETKLRGMFHGGGSHGDFKADTLLCNFSVQGRTLNLDTLKILTNIASVTGGGALALLDSSATEPSDFSLSAIVSSLQPLEGMIGLGPTFLHGASLSVCTVGPPELTRVHCETNVDMAAIGALSLTSMKSSADIRLGPSLSVESLNGESEIRGLHYGGLAIASASVLLQSVKNLYDIHTNVQLGQGSAIKLDGSVRDDGDSVTVVLDTLTASGPAQTWDLEHQASIVYGPRLVVNDFVLHSGSRDIVVKGIIDPKAEQDFTISADSLNVENIGKLFDRPGLNGLVFTKLHVSGSGPNIHALGNLSVSLSNAGVDLGRLSTRLDWKPRSLEVEGGIQQAGGGKLDVSAKIPVAVPIIQKKLDSKAQPQGKTAANPLNVQLKADGFNLEFFRPFLSPASVNTLGGILAADVRVSGALDSIVTEGTASIAAGSFGITQLGTTYSGVELQCDATGKDFRIRNAKVISGEGTLLFSGLVSLKDPSKPAVDVKMTLDKFCAIQTPNIKGIVSGNLALAGVASKPEVTGNLLVNDSYYVMPDEGKLDSVEAVELSPEDYAMLLRYFGYSRPIAVEKDDAGPSAFEPALDLNVTMQKNTWFRKRRNPTLAIELQGTVHIDRRPEQPFRLNGTVRCPAGRSYVGQFGRQFELTEGEILLKGPVKETELHINSEYRVPSKGGTGLSEVVIRMKVESNLGRFVFSLTSDPAMDESEILSYLATGQSRTGALANTGDQGGLAGAMALEQLVGVAGGLTEGSMPLDVFQIRQDGARGITVVAGNYVSSKTYLGVRQPILFNQGTEDTYYDTRTQYELEYEARPWLFLNLQGGSSRTLLMLKARVAY